MKKAVPDQTKGKTVRMQLITVGNYRQSNRGNVQLEISHNMVIQLLVTPKTNFTKVIISILNFD